MDCTKPPSARNHWLLKPRGDRQNAGKSTGVGWETWETLPIEAIGVDGRGELFQISSERKAHSKQGRESEREGGKGSRRLKPDMIGQDPLLDAAKSRRTKPFSINK